MNEPLVVVVNWWHIVVFSVGYTAAQMALRYFDKVIK